MTRDEEVTSPDGWLLNLAVLRVALVAGAVAPMYVRNLLWARGALPFVPEAAWQPVSFFVVLPHALGTNSALLEVASVLGLLLCAGAVLGVRTRACLGALALLSLYAFGVVQNVGRVDHQHDHLVWLSALLALGPSDRRLALDAAGARRRDQDVTAADGQAALLTLRLVWLLLGLVYLFPGVAKLAAALTHGWTGAESLRRIVYDQWFSRTRFDPGFSVPAAVATLPDAMFSLAGLFTIAFEVGFLPLVGFRRWRLPLALAGLAFHAGNGLVLGIWFSTLFPVYAALVDWASLVSRLRARAPAAPAVPLVAASGAGRRAPALLAVGLTLAGAQLGASAVGWILPSWRGPWPFDCYPTFRGGAPTETTVRDAMLIDASGGAARMSPAAWIAMFETPARGRRVADLVAEVEPAAARHEQMRQLLAGLWRHEPTAGRAAARALEVHEQTWALGPQATLVRDRPLDRFTPAELE